MPADQDRLFAESEADRWFERNRGRLERCDPDADLPLRLLDLYRVRPRSALEIGAANGYRLAALAERFGTRAVGVEPSPSAIADGARRFPGVRLVRGLAHDVPIDESFELVILHFVFHWIDRAHLLRAAAEADRMLADGGLLLIGDFLPANRARVGYHHRPDEELFTFKQNYADLFLASGLYHPVGMLTTDHAASELRPDVAEADRIGVHLLRKQLREHYVELIHRP